MKVKVVSELYPLLVPYRKLLRRLLGVNFFYLYKLDFEVLSDFHALCADFEASATIGRLSFCVLCFNYDTSRLYDVLLG